MITAIEFAIAVFGLALLFWAITATDKNAGARAAGASVGLIALLIAAFLGAGREDRDGYRRD
jgi:hypothetical protein